MSHLLWHGDFAFTYHPKDNLDLDSCLISKYILKMYRKKSHLQTLFKNLWQSETNIFFSSTVSSGNPKFRPMIYGDYGFSMSTDKSLSCHSCLGPFPLAKSNEHHRSQTLSLQRWLFITLLYEL
jgi:hypothetical protein